ncbi:hypothetical protein B0F90DRAFT_1622969 [Multifurca ochricompacta]|uniref:White collar 2 protein n=1 Tax=Multifurca ochricompacta TaxID=376703 RepID=A0AAD4QS36_9AGAM|nr:hypothetical protein B0F90DRAFT_1622969 [Multifurca ochricompacta]
MNAVVGPSSHGDAVQLQPNQQQPVPPWEFTRRKRWADLLITELSEAIVLVLSPARKILFCNPAVREILGWQDEDLIDRDITELVNVNDRLSFCTTYAHSIERREELHVYARLRCKSDSSFTHMAITPLTPGKEILLEIIGYPHFLPGQTACKCFFAVAKPYPSRNTAMLNTLLELRVENERLQQHIRALRAHSQQLSAAQAVQHMAPYPSDDLTAQLSTSTNLGLPARPTPNRDPSRPYYSTPQNYEAGGFPAVAALEDDGDVEPRRKKANYIYSQLYICNTCGRTDSPEWRKGPRGPKTLCNACGLRWAKKVRKFEEAAEAGDTNQLPLDDTVPP